MTQTLDKKIALSSWTTRLLLLALILYFSLGTLWLAPPAKANPWVIWLVQTAPLLCFVPGILSGRPRTHAWLCFVILLYFTTGVTTAMGGYPLQGGLLALLTTALFTSAMLFSRWKSQRYKQQYASND
jgi:uncharacterized membrane protein